MSWAASVKHLDGTYSKIFSGSNKDRCERGIIVDSFQLGPTHMLGNCILLGFCTSAALLVRLCQKAEKVAEKEVEHMANGSGGIIKVLGEDLHEAGAGILERGRKGNGHITATNSVEGQADRGDQSDQIQTLASKRSINSQGFRGAGVGMSTGVVCLNEDLVTSDPPRKCVFDGPWVSVKHGRDSIKYIQ